MFELRWTTYSFKIVTSMGDICSMLTNEVFIFKYLKAKKQHKLSQNLWKID